MVDIEGLKRAITNLFYWHPVVQEYYMDILHYSPSKIEGVSGGIQSWKIGWLYIQEHGNSMWAKFDYVVGKVRLVVFVIGVVVVLIKVFSSIFLGGF